MSFIFDHYFVYDELTGFLKETAAKYPQLTRLKSIGKSPQGRDLWLIEITNQNTGPAKHKPAFWIDGNTHAGEVTGSMVALWARESTGRGQHVDISIMECMAGLHQYTVVRYTYAGKVLVTAGQQPGVEKSGTGVARELVAVLGCPRELYENAKALLVLRVGLFLEQNLV